MKASGRRRTWTDPRVLLGIAISLIAIWWTFRDADFSAVGGELAHLRWRFLFGAFPLYFLSLLLRGYRWTYFIPRDNSSLRNRYNACVIGFLATNLFPLRVGEIVRAFVFARRSGRRLIEILATIVTERIFDLISLLILAIVSFPFIPLDRIAAELGADSLFALGRGRLMGFAAALAGGLLIAFILFCLFGRSVLTFLLARLHWEGGRLARFLNTLLDGLETPVKERTLFKVLLWSVGIWFLICLTYWVTLYSVPVPVHGSLAQIVGLSGAIFMQVVICAGIALPSAPGFIGVWHAATRVAFIPFLDSAPDLESKILAYAVVAHLYSYLLTIACGLEAFVNEGMRWSEMRDVSEGGDEGDGGERR